MTMRPKKVPDSAAYFTGNSRLYDLMVGLEKLQESNFSKPRVLTGVTSRQWLSLEKLEKKLDMTLKKQQYAKILEQVSQLTRIELTDDNRSEVMNVVDFFKSEKYTSGYKLNERRKRLAQEAADSQSIEGSSVSVAADGSQATADAIDASQADKNSPETSENSKTSRNPLAGYKDDLGRFYALGRRKSSSSRAYLVPVKSILSADETSSNQESDSQKATKKHPQFLINGVPLSQYFHLQTDAESVLFPLLVSGSITEYNVWLRARGGGHTGQAEASALAIARAVCVANPDLKPFLEKAGCLASDSRRVERKKTGQPKARKKYTWVKR
ncbi:37S ribosomal protein S9, mitochondrial [Smittium mucronatum]|uniref:37S ribosomal protein S9, mitochondrial n=1 Tax=Smittium mucronatum TaxID=133383 RepID=A0A1R0GM10_9FUNG|nr:37S ribosomal protein S9, mitochondrial [Smittium mucronatum]